MRRGAPSKQGLVNGCMIFAFFPDAPKPATMLAAVNDEPLGWPPGGGHP